MKSDLATKQVLNYLPLPSHFTFVPAGSATGLLFLAAACRFDAGLQARLSRGFSNRLRAS
jgi:hypothetical protein